MNPGLCSDCANARHIDAARSTFFFCELSKAQPERYLRYPRLPVLRCAGYKRAAPGP